MQRSNDLCALKYEEMEQKYSLFVLEKPYYEPSSYIGEFKAVCTISCFEYLGTFDTLEQSTERPKRMGC